MKTRHRLFTLQMSRGRRPNVSRSYVLWLFMGTLVVLSQAPRVTYASPVANSPIHVLPSRSPATDSSLSTIYVRCHPDSLARILANPFQNIYIPIEVEFAGRTWTDVRMRIRGDASRNVPKKSFNIDFLGAPFANGRYEINLNAEYSDPSYIHAFLSSYVFRRSGQPCFEVEHTRLFINDRYQGLYVRVENVDEQFLSARGLNPDAALYKADRDNSSMSPYDDVSYHWDKETGDEKNRDDLQELIDEINAVPDEEYLAFCRRTFDYGRMINLLAVNMLISNGSTYYHNYFLFHDPAASSPWTMFPWDLDFTFNTYSSGYPYHRSSGFSNPDNPFLERALLDPTIFQDIRQRLAALTDDFFNPSALNPVIDSLRMVLSSSVEADTSDNIPGLDAWLNQLETEKAYVLRRYANLVKQFSESPAPFRVIRQPEVAANSVTFRWFRSNHPAGKPIQYRVRLSSDRIFPEAKTSVFEGIVDTSLVIPGGLDQGEYNWMVEATDGTNTIEGYDTWNVFYVGSRDTGNVVINEINYNPPDDLDTGDWIELLNPGDRTMDLGGWSIRDNDNSHVFRFPQGTAITAGGYLVVSRDTIDFAIVHPTVTPVLGNLGFGLSSDGESVRLFDAFGALIDSLTFSPTSPWPAEPDGAGATLELIHPDMDNTLPSHWAAATEKGGTPGRQNSRYSENPGDGTESFTLGPVYPVPTAGEIQYSYRLNKPGSVSIWLYDILGRRVNRLDEGEQPVGIHTRTVDLSHLASGIYYVVMTFSDGANQVRRFIISR